MSSTSSSINLVSWNPSRTDEFVQSSHKLELWRIVYGRDTKATQIKNLKSSGVNCIDWQNGNSNHLMAYGDSIGNVNLVDWENDKEILLSNDLNIGKRPCNTVSWNFFNPSQLVAGFEAGKSIKNTESCVYFWDIEKLKARKLPTFEPCSSLAFTTDNGHVFFLGSSVGKVGLFDLRTNHFGHIWTPHIANRPRRIKGVRPNIFNPNFIATFADVGDSVKIWDIRAIREKGTNNPEFITMDAGMSSSRAIHDVCWSPVRSNIFAVTTSANKTVLFYNFHTNSDPIKVQTTSAQPLNPLFYFKTSDIVKSISWRQRTEIVQEIISEKAQPSNPLNPDIESTLVDFTLNYSLPESFEQSNMQIRKSSIPEESRGESYANRLLAAVSNGILDFDVRDDIPLALGIDRIVYPGLRGIEISDLDINSNESISKDPSVKVLDYFHDVGLLLKHRLKVEYGIDAGTNQDIILEELRLLFATLNNEKVKDINLNINLLYLKNKIAELYSLYRLWSWFARLHILKSLKNKLLIGGNLEIFKSNPDVKESTSQSDINVSYYNSTIREIIRVSCGWVGYGLLSNSAVAEDEGLMIDLSNETNNSFERNAVVLLWHGQIDKSVDKLKEFFDIYDHISDHSRASVESADRKEIADEPMTMEYSQLLSLVSMCLAGFNSSQANESQISSWVTMCKYVISQLEPLTRFSSGYLLAGCRFLLAQKDPKNKDSYYRSILSDVKLALEDRLAFAALYLDSKDLTNWMNDTAKQMLVDGNLEGLLLTGLSSNGFSILQRYLDKSDDIQSVALIGCQAFEFLSFDDNSEKIMLWLHHYRSLLNRYELYNARAQLDIELTELSRKNANMSKRKGSDASFPQSGGGSSFGIQNRIKGKEGFQTLSLKKYEQTFPGQLTNNNTQIVNLLDGFRPFQLATICNSCYSSIPIEEIQFNKLNDLRSTKHLLTLTLCSKCKRQLPRCYVCKLSVSLYNPANDVEKLGNNASSRTNKKSDSIRIHDWLSFCQKCRHGGHARCMEKWFEDMEGNGQKVERRGCGVNNCKCLCKFM